MSDKPSTFQSSGDRTVCHGWYPMADWIYNGVRAMSDGQGLRETLLVWSSCVDATATEAHTRRSTSRRPSRLHRQGKPRANEDI